MTKVYLLNQARNTAAFTVYGKSGNAVQYVFKGGNVAANKKPSFATNNEYYQHLLEESELFKKGMIRIDPACLRAIKQMEAEAAAKAQLTPITDVKSVADAVQYCAENFEEVVKTAKQAKACAEKNGYDFVNLKVKD